MRRQHPKACADELRITPDGAGKDGERANQAHRWLVAKLRDRAEATRDPCAAVECNRRRHRQVGVLNGMEAATGLRTTR